MPGIPTKNLPLSAISSHYGQHRVYTIPRYQPVFKSAASLHSRHPTRGSVDLYRRTGPYPAQKDLGPLPCSTRAGEWPLFVCFQQLRSFPGGRYSPPPPGCVWHGAPDPHRVDTAGTPRDSLAADGRRRMGKASVTAPPPVSPHYRCWWYAAPQGTCSTARQ